MFAVGAFAAGLSRFPDARFLACSMTGRADPRYSGRIFLPPSMTPQSHRLFLARQSQGVTVRIEVSRDSTPVADARVCIAAFPVAKPWLAVSDETQRVGPGQYEALLGFDPPGAWGSRVVVVEPGQPPIVIPVSFTVPFPPPTTTPPTTLP